MPKNVAIILSRPYFAFLRNYLPDCEYLISSEKLAPVLDRGALSGSQGQKTADYIIGTSSYRGILHEYCDRGHCTEVFEEPFFLKQGGSFFKNYDLFDMQFSAKLPFELVQALEAHGKQVIGWSPSELGSKARQAVLLKKNNRTSFLLPQQFIFSSWDQLPSLQEAAPPDLQADYWIVKPLYASRSRMPDGSQYRVFHKSYWPQFLELASKHPGWFANSNGLLVSELIETRDPFLNNHNAVLHKVHIPTGLAEDLFRQWPLTCRKMSAHINLNVIGRGIRNLGEILTLETWQTGHLEDYRRGLRDLKDVLPQRPCLYCVDLMIRPDGRMCFLELNKLAGTFIEKIYGDQCPLGLYLEYLEQMGIL